MLLALFAQYEHLSKRISSLPVLEGSSQSTVQSAVARTAAMFLAKEMVKVQVSGPVILDAGADREALPKLQKRIAEHKRQGLGAAVLETTLAEQLKSEGLDSSQAVDVAVTIQPLLEQEAQLEWASQVTVDAVLIARVMVADANAQRKYEDGKALSVALEEIREEIGRLTSLAIS
jgi:hypothetical protein